jgi:hypothetical protein
MLCLYFGSQLVDHSMCLAQLVLQCIALRLHMHEIKGALAARNPVCRRRPQINNDLLFCLAKISKEIEAALMYLKNLGRSHFVVVEFLL